MWVFGVAGVSQRLELARSSCLGKLLSSAKWWERAWIFRNEYLPTSLCSAYILACRGEKHTLLDKISPKSSRKYLLHECQTTTKQWVWGRAVSKSGKSVQGLFGNKLDSATRSGFRGGGVQQGFWGPQPITEMHSAQISLSETTMPNNCTTIPNKCLWQQMHWVCKRRAGLPDPRHKLLYYKLYT
jgi:hypothetical protein